MCKHRRKVKGHPNEVWLVPGQEGRTVAPIYSQYVEIELREVRVTSMELAASKPPKNSNRRRSVPRVLAIADTPTLQQKNLSGASALQL